MLSSFGAMHVDMSYSAEDALDKCKFNFYDIILCDFNLGQGKNGQQVLEALRETKRLKHTHLFIMVTAETAKDVVLGAREYQPDAYVAKPITRSVLEQRLGHLIEQQKILKPINKEIDIKNFPKAISLCHQLLEEKTKYQSWCKQTLGQLYLIIGDIENARQLYEKLLTSRSVPWASLGLGQALMAAQKYSEAITSFEKCIDDNPNMVEAYDGLSQCYLKTGQQKKAQNALETATELSPRVITRHEKLGAICQQNQDIPSASKAFRHAIKFGEHSIYEKPDNYLSLGRCLSEWSEGDDTELGKSNATEALNTLETLTNKYSNHEDACLNATLIEARIYINQDEPDAAANKLHQAECMIEEENISADVGLELAKTLHSMGQPARAESLLIDLAKRFETDEQIVAKIEELLDEPESLKTRKQAKELNKTGIKQFEQGELLAAIDAFQSAIALTPKHAALNLNIVQVLIKQYKKSNEPKYLQSAQESIDRIKHIPEQHNQFNRMKHLTKSISKLNARHTTQQAGEHYE
jgi:tetratricopeptide (TPR) repeat protein